MALEVGRGAISRRIGKLSGMDLRGKSDSQVEKLREELRIIAENTDSPTQAKNAREIRESFSKGWRRNQ